MKTYLRIIILLHLFYPFVLFAKDLKSFANNKNLCFIENKGQITDQFGKSRNDIQFKISATKGLNIFIGNGQLHYQWSKPINTAQNEFCHAEPDRTMTVDLNPKNYIEDSIATFRMDVELLGSNPIAEIITEEKQDYYENYYTHPFDPDHGTIAHSYRKITYKNIYPNIDWVLCINNTSPNASPFLGEGRSEDLKYNFIVHPGANVSDIKIKYNGATGIALNNDGGITTISPMGKIEEKKPFSYEAETGKNVSSEFVLTDNILSFHTELYNGTLIIDPVLLWATYFGGSDWDYGNGVSCDPAGNVFITGWTLSASNIATTGSFQSVYGGDYDAFIAKFNASGLIQWASYFGGDSEEQSNNIVCDRLGNVFITGYTASITNIATSNSYQSTISGTVDVFLAKFDNSGAIQWATYYGGPGGEYGRGITCDNTGNVYITGYTTSSPGIATPGSHQSTFGGIYDAFLAKFGNLGNLKWATYYGGNTYDYGNGVTCDSAGNVFLVGVTYSANNIATPGCYQSMSGSGAADAYLVKFDSTGVRQWGTYYGSIGSDDFSGVACDKLGNVYAVGSTDNSTAIATPGSYQSVFGGMNDAYLVKFNGSGLRLWATYYGGSKTDVGTSIVFNNSGSIFIAGYTASTANIATPGSYQTILGGGTYDAFLAQFNVAGILQWATYFGGTNWDHSSGVDCDGIGNIYLVGSTASSNNIATPGIYQDVYGGGAYDAFLAKFGADDLVTNLYITDSIICTNDTFLLSYNVNKPFQSGNVFTAQLSDASGSFNNPINIGSVTSTVSGSIVCTIPANISSGTSYLIRVFSTNPTDTFNSITLNIYPKISPHFSFDSILCQASPVIVSAANLSLDPSFYLWNFGNASIISGKGAGPYYISYSDTGYQSISLSFLGACTPADTQLLYIHPLPLADINASKTIICDADSIQLAAIPKVSGILNYQWLPVSLFGVDTAAVTNVVIGDSAYLYLKFQDQNKCVGTDSIFINVYPCCGLFIPNAFTPNNDGKNDKFRVLTKEHFKSFEFEIVDRWGELIFKASSPDKGWDGTYNGSKMEIGSYFYYVKYNCGGKDLFKKGDLTLIR